jgi:hypothetical protein
VFEAVEVADYLAQETSTDLVFQNIGGDLGCWSLPALRKKR